MLHLVTQVIPDISVIWIDTGYLPPETYTFTKNKTMKLTKHNLSEKTNQVYDVIVVGGGAGGLSAGTDNSQRS